MNLPSTQAFLNFLNQLQIAKAQNSRIKPKIRWIFSSLYFRFEDLEDGIDSDEASALSEPYSGTHSRTGTLSVLLGKGHKLHFIVTFKPLPQLNGAATVIGHAISGFKAIEYIRDLGHTFTGKPQENVVISDWGYIRDTKRQKRDTVAATECCYYSQYRG